MNRKKIALSLAMLIMMQGISYSFADNYPAYMKGFADGSFKAENLITRAEASVIVSNLIGYEEFQQTEYKDIKKDNWAYKSVNHLRTKKILSSDEYNITENISRGELCSIIAKAYNLTKDDANIKKFKDIEKNKYKKYIDIMTSKKYMKGFPDGSFKPDKALTRAEMTVIINKVTGREKDIDKLKKMTPNLTIPKDLTSKHWAYKDIISAVNNLKEKDDELIENEIKNKNSSNNMTTNNLTIDYKNLKDGEYKLNIALLKSAGEKNPTEKSMANNAISNIAILKVENSKATLYMQMEAMKLRGLEGKKGHLENAWYYENKDTYLKYLSTADKALLKNVELISTYKDNSKTYPKIIAFPIQIGEKFAYIKVEVDIMKELGASSPDAVVSIDWNSIEINTEND